MTQPDLFTYPNAPGHKTGGTSKQALKSASVDALRDAIDRTAGWQGKANRHRSLKAALARKQEP